MATPENLSSTIACPRGGDCPRHELDDVEAREFSDQRRQTLADEEKALPDGSFPIVSAKDLHNAIAGLGRAKDPVAARAHIIHRARALDLVDQLPPDWEVDAGADLTLAALSLNAEALGSACFVTDVPHPNQVPFKAVLHQVDRPSDRAPGGAQGHRVLIPRLVAERRLGTLLHMGLNVQAGLNGHQVTNKVGVITHAAVGEDPCPEMRVPNFRPDPNAVMVAGWLYGKDFPREVAAIRAAAAQGTLGTSYELANARVRDPRAPIWVLDDFIYTGAAALSCDAAAYADTQLAAEKEKLPMPDPTPQTPAAAPAADPSMLEQLKSMVGAMLSAGFDAIRQEFSARFQAVEGALATLNTRPGERPDEMEMREQSQQCEAQAAQLDSQVLSKREEATALRAAGQAEQAAAAEQAAGVLQAQAAARRAQGRQLHAKAFGYGPVIQAVKGLITDELAGAEKRLSTELGAQVTAGFAKLTTDPGVQRGKGGGGQVDIPPPPERMSLSAGAMRLASKFEDQGRAGVTEAELDAAMRAAGTPLTEQIALKTEFSRAGRLRAS